VLKLRLGAARELLRPELASTPTGPAALLVANCADFAELIVTQDARRYDALVAAQEAHLNALNQAPAGALRDYARAEITLHLGLSQLAFRHLVAGGFHLRGGYHQMQAVVKRYPGFAPARKTLGICQFAVGSLPEGYHWLLRLLGLSADVDTGLNNLALAAAQPHDFQIESQLYLTLIRESYYKKPAEALRLVEHLVAQQPENLLFAYLLVSVHKRQHQGDAALAAYRPGPPAPATCPWLTCTTWPPTCCSTRATTPARNAKTSSFCVNTPGSTTAKTRPSSFTWPPGWGGSPPRRLPATGRKSASPGPPTWRKTTTPSITTRPPRP
jgi:hypothetical protein